MFGSCAQDRNICTSPRSWASSPTNSSKPTGVGVGLLPEAEHHADELFELAEEVQALDGERNRRVHGAAGEDELGDDLATLR